MYRAALREADLVPGRVRAQRVEQAGRVDPQREVRVVQAHVLRERVAAEHRAGLVRPRPEHGDPLHRKRQGAVVGQQHDRFLGKLPGQRAGPLVIEAAGRFRLRRPAGVQQPQLAFLLKDPGCRAVHQGGGHLARLDRLQQRRAVAVHDRQFHVHAGREGLARGVTAVGGHAVHGLQERHREVVGDHGPGEAGHTAEPVGQQRRVRGGRHAVQVGVGGHDRPRARAQRHLERRQEHVGHLPRADGDRRHVAPGA